MGHYGAALKQIRTGKRISQSFFEKRKILSQSQLSRIESGKSEVTFSDVIEILDALHISVEEFLYISNNYSHQCSWQIIREVQEALNDHNIIKLKELEKKIYDKSLISDDFIYVHYLSVCKAYILQMENQFEEAGKIIQPVKNYLIKVDDWCTYEMTLLKYSLPFLDKEILDNISNLIFRSIEKYKNMENGIQLYTSFVSSLALFYLQNRDFKKVILLCDQVLNNKIDKNMMSDVIDLSIIKGMAIYMTGDRKYGKKLIIENWSILETIHISDSLLKFKKVASDLGISHIMNEMGNRDFVKKDSSFIEV